MNENEEKNVEKDEDVIDFDQIFEEHKKEEKPKFSYKRAPFHASVIVLYILRDLISVLISMALLAIPTFVGNFSDDELVVRAVAFTFDAIGFVEGDEIPNKDDYAHSVAVLKDKFYIGGTQYLVILNPSNQDLILTDSVAYSDDPTAYTVTINKTHAIKTLVVQETIDGTFIKWKKNENNVLIVLSQNSPAKDYMSETSSFINYENVRIATPYEKSSMLNFTVAGMGLFQLFAMAIITIPACFLLKKDIATDIGTLRIPETNRRPIYQILTGVAYVFGASVFLGMISMALGTVLPGSQVTSQNQAFINIYSVGIGALLLGVTTVLVGPILEELVFRKSFFGLIKNNTVALIVSAISFGLIHVSSEILAGDWVNVMLSGISYIGMGFMFGWLYLRSNKNVVVTICIHAGYNLIATLLPLLLR